MNRIRSTQYLGSTVYDEGHGRGTIVDETPTCVGVQFKRDRGCKVWYIRKTDLIAPLARSGVRAIGGPAT